MAITYNREDGNQIFVPVATATGIEIGDICALVSGEAVPAEDFAWAGSKAATQYNFVAALLGHSFQYKEANNPSVYGNQTANIIGVSTSGTFLADVQSATTFAVGDFVGLAKAVSSNNLLNQTVEKVASLPLAIGVVVEAGVDLEQVMFRLLPTAVPFEPAPATTTSTTTAAPTTTSTTTT